MEEEIHLQKRIIVSHLFCSFLLNVFRSLEKEKCWVTKSKDLSISCLSPNISDKHIITAHINASILLQGVAVASITTDKGGKTNIWVMHESEVGKKIHKSTSLQSLLPAFCVLFILYFYPLHGDLPTPYFLYPLYLNLSFCLCSFVFPQQRQHMMSY